MRHATTEELTAALDDFRASPSDDGALRLIVARPSTEQRRLLDEGRLDLEEGLVGDNWRARGSKTGPGGAADPERQLTIMNARVLALIAGDRSRWELAGDQLIVDFHLGVDNIPPGSILKIGEAHVQVTEPPHTGCKKFVARFGMDAMQFVNSPVGRSLNLRGINARVVQPGVVRVGDVVSKGG